MAEDDTEDEDADPAVELGDGEDVEGAPVARVAARLTWPQEASRIRQKEGHSVIRTPEGPRELAEILEEADETYYESRQAFREQVRRVVGTGPVETVE